jgi:peptidoglycan/xylan/chitin deacetylase (PgdA/CDA1 family)
MAMTAVLITVDTELSALLHQRGHSAQANFHSSILGQCAYGAFGIGWQMDVLDRNGLKGVYFVDPLPALVLGEAVIADVVGLIADRGHDVQLHAHPEWLEWAQESPVEGRVGRNIADFSLADQIALLEYGCGVIERAGAARPVAFRAGNFGANDDSLRALAALGLAWDSSVNADYLGGACRIGVTPERNLPLELHSIAELPVSGLHDRTGHFRPAQVCAMSGWEMRDTLRHAAARGHPVVTVVTHSFEMLSRDRSRANRAVMKRFEGLARFVAAHPLLETTTFQTLDRPAVLVADAPRAGPNRLRTAARMVEQAAATVMYEHKLRRA